MEVVKFSEDVGIGAGSYGAEHVQSALLEDHVLEVGVADHLYAPHAFSSEEVGLAAFDEH